MKLFVHAIQHSVIPFVLLISGFSVFNGTLGKRFRGNRLVQIVSIVWICLCVVSLVIFVGWGRF
jgi:hypothetical protein